MLLADFDDANISTAAIRTLESLPSLKIAAVSRGAGTSKYGKEMETLVKAGRIEPVVSLTDEPALPLIYEFSTSTSTDLRFAWPDDVADIVARGQERVLQIWPRSPKGLLLETGALDANIMPLLKALDISWVALPAETAERNNEFPAGAFDGCAVLRYRTIDSPGGLAAGIRGSSAPVEVYMIAHASRLTRTEFGAYAQALHGAGAEAVLPSMVPKALQPALDAKQISADLSRYTARKDLWKKLAAARTEIENYKNSGNAQPKTLEAARTELYHLYASPLIMAPQRAVTQEEEQGFQAGLFNVYQLAGRQMPADLNNGAPSTAELFISSASGQYLVECSSYNFVYHNPPRADGGPAIASFSMQLNDEEVSYAVALTGPALPATAYVDVYMDLNNRRGAGSTTMLLPMTDGYLDPEDAWEFALQIGHAQAVLYRAGRFQNAVVATFKTKKPFEVSVPRSFLKGNALRWGYQAVLVSPSTQKDIFDISDFLVKNEVQRLKVLKNKPTYLPAARVNK